MLVYKKQQQITSILTNNNKLKHVECSNDKTTWQLKKTGEATEYAWIKLNNTKAINFIVVDIDNKQFNKSVFNNAIKTISPNYVVWSPYKENSVQVGYVLKETVFTNTEETLYNEVRTMLNKLYRADEYHKNIKAKNPLCAFWTTVFYDNDFYTLTQLKNLLQTTSTNTSEKITTSEEITLEQIQTTTKNEAYKYNANSSNCANFDNLRLKAYEFTETFRQATTSDTELYNALFKFLETQQNAEIYKHQTEKERKATIKSICKFCVLKYKSENDSKYTKINKLKRDEAMKRIEYIKTNYDINERFTKQQYEEIAKVFNVNVKTVRVYLSAARKRAKIGETEAQKEAKEIAKLKDFNKLKFSEIAKLMNKTESTIKTIYYRTIKKNNA